MSNLFDQISEDIQKAMLAHDHVRTETLRGVKKEFLEAKTAKGAEGELTDSHAIEILQKMKKQRLDAAQIYHDNGRPELAEGEEAEAKILEEYLPKQMVEGELTEYIRALIEKLGVTDMKGMGRIMGTATKELAGKAQGGDISRIVKQLLSGK
ncbi:MAG: GatB/YqeY domain-containing protein [Porphyromonas sp.]|uniref:GatB/YqeY domain-containing protein n=1 Tax=Porphyromonas sp. TaxID=1924944 RepID=UPI002A90F985|nr:GatB/YqeY domain-containing protein [Porphyromonas sp.]MDD7468510.1 GatB/YqeY domain-containing protein [Bacteroidales bacterium]MDY6101884.1 GatB/YqeY domain-containing protein [Porphyromonas sp.]